MAPLDDEHEQLGRQWHRGWSLIQPDSFGELPLEKDPEYRRLFKRFPKNTTLRSVSIAGHPLNESTQRALVQALETSQLQSLDVRGCGVSNKTLLKCVLRNRSLCELQRLAVLYGGLGEALRRPNPPSTQNT